VRQYLIVANQTLNCHPLFDTAKYLVGDGPSTVHLLVPATPAREQLIWTEGGAHAIARQRLAEALERFGRLPATIRGEVGDANPVHAVHDVLARGGTFDLIVVSTLPTALSRWLGQDLPRRIERSTGLPVRAIVTACPSDASGAVTPAPDGAATAVSRRGVSTAWALPSLRRGGAGKAERQA
jgi:hypothetical protein